MCNLATENSQEAKEIVCMLLKDAGLSGFSFDTSFTLKFSRNEAVEYKGNILPFIFELHLLSDWWFGSKDEWQTKVKKFDVGKLIEPDEPVKAFELASLRWVEGSEIDLVEFQCDVMVVKFKNRKQLTISLYSEIDYSWVIKEFKLPQSMTKWSIACENGDFHLNTP